MDTHKNEKKETLEDIAEEIAERYRSARIYIYETSCNLRSCLTTEKEEKVDEEYYSICRKISEVSETRPDEMEKLVYDLLDDYWTLVNTSESEDVYSGYCSRISAAANAQ
jgi:hypothetical protein